MSEPTSVYQEHSPCAGLQSWVAYTWSFVAGGSSSAASGPLRHPIPPEAGITVTMIPHFESTVLAGPHANSVDVAVEPGSRVCGVRFWPGTAPAFLTATATSLVGKMVPTASVSPSLDRALNPVRRAFADDATIELDALSELFDQALLPLLPQPGALDSEVMQGVFMLLGRRSPSVADVARTLGLSTRQFRRRFKESVGLSPREFKAVRRLRATMVESVLNSTTAWADLAAQNGYADQPHLCREFRRLTERSPEEYRHDIGHIAHRKLVG